MSLPPSSFVPNLADPTPQYDLAARAAMAAADAQANLALAAQPPKRKRKDPPAEGATAEAAARAPVNPAAAAAAASPSTSNGHASALSPSSASYKSSLVDVTPALQSALQNEILTIFWPATKQHGHHLYRQLPGPQPFSIVRKDLNLLAQNDYWACEKSDGERAMLYVSKERQATFVIDRKFHVQQLKSPVYAEMWSTAGDTLIDGELVLSSDASPTTYFIAFDLILLQGERVLDKKLSERLGKIGMGIIKPYRTRFPNYATDTSDHPLPIRAKNFVKKSALHEGLMKFIRPHGAGEYEYNDGKRRNKNDGVIFTPENDDYNCKNVQLLKWKFPGLNTIDFMIRHPWFDDQGRLMLYSSANLASEREGQKPQTVIVHVRSTTLHPEKKRWLLGEVTGKQQAIVEMAYEIHSSSWQPKLFRWDKSSPNFMTTVIGTLETVMDNVQPVDLCQACGSKRSGSANPPPQQQQQPHQQHHAAAPPQPSLSSSASSAASHFGGIPADQASFWSSGASAAAAVPSSRAAPPRSFSPPPATAVSSASVPFSAPAFSPFDTPMIDTSGPAPMATSKSISVFEQIASASEVPVVETSRLFGD